MEREELLGKILLKGLYIPDDYENIFVWECYEILQDRGMDMKRIRVSQTGFSLCAYDETWDVYSYIRNSVLCKADTYGKRCLAYGMLAAEVEEAYRHSMDESRLRMARERRGISNYV